MVTAARALELARKAVTRPPAQTLARVRDETVRALWRPWTRIRPRLLTEARLLAAAGAPSIDALWNELASAPFFLTPDVRDAWVAAHRARFPQAAAEIVEAADRILRHEFDLLGSGPRVLGARLPWHEDFKTGRVWPLAYSPDLEFLELDRRSDVKVPWELSRCQHFARLGQAYWLTGDERYAEEYVAEIADWIDRNPWGHGVNWICAMDVALRAVSWIWGFYFVARSRACADRGFRSRLLRSLFLHGEWVASHLEIGPVTGNHYLADGVGLVFLGSFFARTAAGRAWLETGRGIVIGELPRQVTEDGVDFEASTAYHRLVLELFLTACLLLRRRGERVPPAHWARLERMCEFVEAYVKPDGLAPLVGDADDGRVQILGRQPVNDHRYLLSMGAALFGRGDFKRTAGAFHEEAFWLLGPEGAAAFDALDAPAGDPPSRAFFEGGFFVLRDGATHVFVDCGPVGMRGLGGHGHNDILAFELVLDGVRLVTDCGTYVYTASREWRNRFRSTACHSTIQVDGEEVNRLVDPDALWRLHDDAVPEDVSFEAGPDRVRFRGAHRGYGRLTPPVRVAREIVLARGRGHVFVADAVEGTGRHLVEWRFPLEPGLECVLEGGDVRLAAGGAERWLLPIAGAGALAWTVEPGWVSPRYGVKVETEVLTARAVLQLPFRMVYLFARARRSEAERQVDARDAAVGA